MESMLKLFVFTDVEYRSAFTVVLVNNLSSTIVFPNPSIGKQLTIIIINILNTKLKFSSNVSRKIN